MMPHTAEPIADFRSLAGFPGYYILASCTEAGRLVLAPELRTFIGRRYTPGMLPAPSADGLSKEEADALAYRMGRADGERAIAAEVQKAAPNALRAVFRICHLFVPRAKDHLASYRGVTRHYVTGVWQGASLALSPMLVSDGLGVNCAGTDLEVEARLEQESMTQLPLWELRHAESVPMPTIEGLAVRAARMALLTDEAQGRARVALAALAEAGTADVRASVRRARDLARQHGDIVADNRLSRILALPLAGASEPDHSRASADEPGWSVSSVSMRSPSGRSSSR